MTFLPSSVESGRGFMDIGVRAFPPIEALVYMPRIDVCELVLACLERSPFPIGFPSLVLICEKWRETGFMF